MSFVDKFSLRATGHERPLEFRTTATDPNFPIDSSVVSNLYVKADYKYAVSTEFELAVKFTHTFRVAKPCRNEVMNYALKLANRAIVHAAMPNMMRLLNDARRAVWEQDTQKSLQAIEAIEKEILGDSY